MLIAMAAFRLGKRFTKSGYRIRLLPLVLPPHLFRGGGENGLDHVKIDIATQPEFVIIPENSKGGEALSGIISYMVHETRTAGPGSATVIDRL
jgi:hypothetical protein